MSLLSVGIIMLIFLIGFIMSFFTVKDDDWNLALKIITVLGFVGWGIGGLGINGLENYEKMVVYETTAKNVVKTETRVICEIVYNDKIYTYETDKIKDFTSISDSTKFYIVRYFNYYGFEKKKRDYTNLTKCDYFISMDSRFHDYISEEKIDAFEID